MKVSLFGILTGIKGLRGRVHDEDSRHLVKGDFGRGVDPLVTFITAV